MSNVGTAGSSTWLVTIAADAPGRRGYLYEVVGLRRAIDDGLVGLAKLKGMGFKLDVLDSTVEGDAVEDIVAGAVEFSGSRFIDFKAMNATPVVDDLTLIDTLLRERRIKQWVFAWEEFADIPGPGSAWRRELNEINERLIRDELEPIVFDWVLESF